MNNLFINLNNAHWAVAWSKMLTQPPFYSGDYAEQIQQVIQKLAIQMEQGDSCLVLPEFPIFLEELCENKVPLLSTDRRQDEYILHRPPLLWQAPYLYIYRYWQYEYELAQSLKKLLKEQIDSIDFSPFSHLLHDEHQQNALKIGVNEKFAMITGGPGTGKTYVLTRIVAVLKKLNPTMRIAMAAPTGKAAQRMQEALQWAFNDEEFQRNGLYHADFAQQNTQTLHRLLGIGGQQRPRYHADFPLPYDVVVVDEASMLDLQLAKMLFAALSPQARLILLGDAYQLSSVDVGQVLADLQQVQGLKPYHITLQTSRRFSDHAMIGRLAKFIYAVSTDTVRSLQQWRDAVQPEQLLHLQQFEQAYQRIQQHEQADWVGFFQLEQRALEKHHTDRVEELARVDQFLIHAYRFYIQALQDYQQHRIHIIELFQQFDRFRILVATQYFDMGLHRINRLISDNLKQQFQQNMNSEWFFGRAVMMTYNDYQLGLSNGDIGLCVYVNDVDRAYFSSEYPQQDIMVYFPSLGRFIAAARLPQNIETAFALTIHKSQGSEFEHIAVLLDEQAEQLLSRELFYTAVTRAKKMVSIFANEQALMQSLNIQSVRQSGLVTQIEQCLSRVD